MKKPLEVLRIYAEHNYTLNGAFTSRAARDSHREFIFFNGKSWSWQSFGDAVALFDAPRNEQSRRLLNRLAE